MTSDEYNTKIALTTMKALLSRKLKKDHRADYYRLHNNLISYFSTHKQYSHKLMLDYVIGDYKPVDSDLKISDLRSDAEDLPAKHHFDSRFTISQDLVEKGKKTVIPLTPQIDLELKEAIDSLPETIYAASLEDGTKGVFIRSDDGFKHFKTGNDVVVSTN
jgi:hypothetical protein